MDFKQALQQNCCRTEKLLQKTCDSFRVSSVNKEKIKELRIKYKK